MGDMLVFTMIPHPTISVAIGERGNNKDQTNDIEIDSDSSEDQIDDDDRIVVANEFVSTTMRRTASLSFYQ